MPSCSSCRTPGLWAAQVLREPRIQLTPGSCEGSSWEFAERINCNTVREMGCVGIFSPRAWCHEGVALKQKHAGSSRRHLGGAGTQATLGEPDGCPTLPPAGWPRLGGPGVCPEWGGWGHQVGCTALIPVLSLRGKWAEAPAGSSVSLGVWGTEILHPRGQRGRLASVLAVGDTLPEELICAESTLLALLCWTCRATEADSAGVVATQLRGAVNPGRSGQGASAP